MKIYGGAAIFLLLAIGAAYAVAYSPLFKIRNIEVGGNEYVSSEEIISQIKRLFIEKSPIAKFLGEDNILAWESGAQSIGFLSPRIKSLKIEKDYFSRSIKIVVSEREKFGVWCQPASCWWFDKSGVLFSNAVSSEGNLINKVDDFSGRPLKIGEQALEGKLLSNLIKIFAVLEKADLGIKSLKLERLELQEIIANPSTGSGQAESSPVIYFSLRIDPSFGLAAIESLKSTGLNKLEYIDLRVENRAYYKPR